MPAQPTAATKDASSAARRRPARPPRGALSQEQLARQARAFLSDAVRLARWAHRTGTAPGPDPGAASGELGLTPGQVRDHWSRARLAGLVEYGADEDAEGGVRAGWRLRAWERDDSAVLRGWVALFDGWSLARSAPDDADPHAVAEVVSAVPQLLSVMQLSDGPVTEAGLRELLLQRVAELRAERAEAATAGESDGPVPGQAPGEEAELVRLLGWALDALAAVGALSLQERDGLPARARLTELGSWATWTKLEHICIAAQSPVGNIEQSAVGMLRGCATLTPGPARAEYRAWLAARTTGPAVAELLDAARGEDALIRGLAFEALRVVGAPAQDAVRAVTEEPALRPYALLWLAEQETGEPEDGTEALLTVLTREEATWLWVDTASAAHDHGAARLLLDHLEAAVQPTVGALLQEVRTCGHPRTVQVLLALAAVHPEPAVARRIRRAAFQLHTGGS
ncbi:hypothetical protein PJ985_12755 [Streptomyces sp. ACA25]|uniref:hypothetical protein n=1 Tax=Streptomyces sp. ACA25 TaxID=3022596 RepID=UPI002307361D|nr:hypothetical protein [Streptomyces sp. ACA25]MDB1088435.1 hypothetical protein [Streptomyces sp. ACA25]